MQDFPRLDWANLRNPVFTLPNAMVKDQVVVYHAGRFYLFASIRENSASPTGAQPFFRTSDFHTYESFSYEGSTDSPDIMRYGTQWFLVFQDQHPSRCWLAKILKRLVGYRRLYGMASQDLMHWADKRELLRVIQPLSRHIDGAVAVDNGYVYLGYKRWQTFYITRSPRPVWEGRFVKPMQASADGEWAENFQFLRIDGQWRMLATGRDPQKANQGGYTASHEPFLYTRVGHGEGLEAWARWTHRRQLMVPREAWNGVMHANSAYLCDWRDGDGYFYLFYAGAADSTSFEGRGHGKIGMARSRDLETWRVPGEDVVA